MTCRFVTIDNGQKHVIIANNGFMMNSVAMEVRVVSKEYALRRFRCGLANDNCDTLQRRQGHGTLALATEMKRRG